MKLSLIIATYNRSQSLIRTLHSVAEQTFDPKAWECIVVDNRSTDDTKEQVAKFCELRPDLNINYLFEANQGLSAARNCGLSSAVGEIVAFVDDDETLESSFIGSYIDFFATYADAMAAGGGVIARYDNGRPAWMSPYTEQMIANPIDLGSRVRSFPSSRIPAGGNMAFRRSLFDHIEPFNTQLGRCGTSLIGGEESELFGRIRSIGCTLYYVPNAAIYHHIAPEKVTDDYFDRLAFNVGRSQRYRAELNNSTRMLHIKEYAKWLATEVIALTYNLCGKPLQARYLRRMRRGIGRGIRTA